MKKDLTELVFILDGSSSMAELTSSTIQGFNSLIEKEKMEEGECLVSLVIFSDFSSVIYDRVNILSVPPLTEKEYRLGGCTALLDAVGGAIHHIGNVHKHAGWNYIPAKTMFVITTDGIENASRLYTAGKVRSMIRREREKYGWEFLFLGAGMDAATTASKYGIDRRRSAEYRNDDRGIMLYYESLSKAVSGYRRSGDIDESWADDIRRDCKAGKNRN